MKKTGKLKDNEKYIQNKARHGDGKISISTDDMLCFYLRKNVQNMVNPVGKFWIDEVARRDCLKFRVLDKVCTHRTILRLFLILVKLVEADWRDLSPGADAGNLCAKVVRLVSRKRRIADYLSNKCNTGLIL